MRKILSYALLLVAISISLSSIFRNTFSSFDTRFLWFLSVSLLYLSVFHFYHSNKKYGTFLALAFTAFFFFSWENRPIFFSSSSGALETSEVVMLAQRYNQTGIVLTTNSTHSYFFQTPYLIFVISKISGFSPSIAVYGIAFCFITLTTLVGIHILEILRKEKRFNQSFFPSAVAFFIVSTNSTIVMHDRFYRDLGLSILLLIFCLFVAKSPKKSNSLIILLLIVGATVGSPISAIIIILFFSFLALYKYQALRTLLYACVPLTYMTYVSSTYLYTLRNYAFFSFEGVAEFLRQIVSGAIPERVVPWGRTSQLTLQDKVLLSISNLAFLLLAMLLAISVLFLIRRDKFVRKGSKTLLTVFSLFLWVTLTIVAVTYIGSSTMPEKPFSDIRIVVTIFLSAPLPFIFLTKDFFRKIASKKALSFSIVLLMLLACLRVAYEAYPKSIYDPINAVEDYRLGSTSIDVVGDFIQKYYMEGMILCDYDVLIRNSRQFSFSYHDTRLLDEATFNKTFFDYQGSILVFNVYGIIYPSIYHSSEAYIMAYNFSLTEDVIYSNGVVLVVYPSKATP